jgi:hypothetical protein
MRSGKHIVALGVSVVLVAIGGNGRALAQGAEQQMPKSKILDVPAAVLRTMADIKNDQLKAAPLAPAGGIPFRPGMDAAAYEAEKAAALSRGASSGRSAAPVQAPGPLAVVAEMNCDGANQTGSGNWYPPDADSAVGLTQLVQVSNTNITIWDKTAVGSTGCPDPLTNPLFSSDLNSFFGYVGPGATTLFDPRVVHDDVYGRWIVAADAFPDSAGAQLQFIAASTTEDAIGPYLVVALNTRSLTCPTCFWDYPQLGLDEDSIMLTANIFNPGYVDSRWLFLNKARLYAGIGGAFGCFFFGFGTGTPSWAPPKAMDLNPITYMIEAPPSGAALSLIA